jgi:Flp pilus assembly pilin Flp
MRREGSGQNLIEVLIILGLVSVAAIFALTIFGGEINTMFSKSHDNVKDFDPFNAKDTVASVPSPPASVPVSSETIHGYSVDFYSDGSASFNVSGQDVYLDNEIIDKMDVVMETTGASSVERLIKEIGYMIEEHKTEYEPNNVPVEVIYGSGDRVMFEEAFLGEAVVNSVAITVGDHMVILQNDQECNVVKAPSPGNSASCSDPWIDYRTTAHRIEMHKDHGNSYILDDYSNDNTTMSINSMSGTFKDGKLTTTYDYTTSASDPSMYKDYSGSDTWDFNFSDIDNTYLL